MWLKKGRTYITRGGISWVSPSAFGFIFRSHFFSGMAFSVMTELALLLSKVHLGNLFHTEWKWSSALLSLRRHFTEKNSTCTFAHILPSNEIWTTTWIVEWSKSSDWKRPADLFAMIYCARLHYSTHTEVKLLYFHCSIEQYQKQGNGKFARTVQNPRSMRYWYIKDHAHSTQGDWLSTYTEIPPRGPGFNSPKPQHNLQWHPSF